MNRCDITILVFNVTHRGRPGISALVESSWEWISSFSVLTSQQFFVHSKFHVDSHKGDCNMYYLQSLSHRCIILQSCLFDLECCLCDLWSIVCCREKERERERERERVPAQKGGTAGTKSNGLEKRAAADVASALESYEAENGEGYSDHYLMKSTIMSGCKCIDVQSKTAK
ncbi:hypothetical protein YC2023_071385 [Brassica napus]